MSQPLPNWLRLIPWVVMVASALHLAANLFFHRTFIDAQRRMIAVLNEETGGRFGARQVVRSWEAVLDREHLRLRWVVESACLLAATVLLIAYA